MTDILNGNTNPRVNPFWGKFGLEGPGGDRRPATLKTGTNNDAKDLNAYGYIAPPTEAGRKDGAYALAVGAWNGNSDNTRRRPGLLDRRVHVRLAGLPARRPRAKWGIRRFERPEGLTQVAIDPFTGLLPSAGTEGVDEWFIGDSGPDTQVGADVCGEKVLTVAGHEDKFKNWMAADRDWIARAERGPGTRGGPDNTRVAYFYNPPVPAVRPHWGAHRRG